MWLLWDSATVDFSCWSSYWVIFPWKEKSLIVNMWARDFPHPHLVQGLQLLVFPSVYTGDTNHLKIWGLKQHNEGILSHRLCIANPRHLGEGWKKSLSHPSNMNCPKVNTCAISHHTQPYIDQCRRRENPFTSPFSFCHARDWTSQGRTQKVVFNVFTSKTPKLGQTTATRA